MKWRSLVPPVVASWAQKLGLKSIVSDFMRGSGLPSGGSSLATLSQPYAQVAHVRAAVNHIASPISGRPLVFMDGKNEFTDPAFADWWAYPAWGPKVRGVRSRLPRADVLRDLASWLALEGEYFLCVSAEWLITAGRTPARAAQLPPFLIANPQRMRHVVHGGVLQGWEYVDAGGVRELFLPEQVIQRKQFNPYDDFRGLGAMQAALVAAEGAFLTGTYVRDLARNNGDQGMVVIGKDGEIDDTQREQILADLRKKRAALQHGVVKDLLLGGNFTVERPQEKAASPELLASKGLSQQEIFVAFNVPPSLGEVKAAYSVGKESDKYQLITDTCQPIGQHITGGLAAVASLQTGRVLTADLDWNDHPVMVEVRNGRIETALKLWGAGMSMKDANDYLGLRMKPFPGWGQGYLPFSVAPVDAIGEPATAPENDPQLAEPDSDVAKLRVLLATRARLHTCAAVEPKGSERDPLAGFTCACHGSAGVTMKERDKREVAQWRDLMAKRRATVKSFESGIGRVLTAARAETLRKIETIGAKAVVSERSATGPATERKAAAADFLFDLAKFADAFTATMRDRSRAALDTAGKQLLAEVGKDDAFKFPSADVLDFLSGRENKLRDVPRAIFEEIKATIESGLIAGDTTEQLAARVRSSFNGITAERARRIALTETGAAYGAGRDAAMVQAGVRWKKWLTSGNDNVRPAHADANGQIVAIDEAFTVDGEALMFPGDDSGSPGNVINCHCVSVASASGPDGDS